MSFPLANVIAAQERKGRQVLAAKATDGVRAVLLCLTEAGEEVCWVSDQDGNTYWGAYGSSARRSFDQRTAN